MTKQEFEKRTGVEVSAYEFECINFVYIQADADCDKDVFCRMWKKMNADRVKLAKIKREAEGKEPAHREVLFSFYNKTKKNDQYVLICYVPELKENVIEALSFAGIRVDDGTGLKDLWDVRYEIGKYLDIL